MKFILLFFLAAFALGSAEEEEEEECPQLDICIESLLVAVFEGSTDEEVCEGISTSIECLREKSSECNFDPAEIEDGLEQFQIAYHESCRGEGYDHEDDEMRRCYAESEHYINECMNNPPIEHIIEVIGEKENLDENIIACTLYNMIAECFLDKLGEKCGEEAAELGKQELYSDVPDEVKEACEKDHDIPSFMFLEKKK